MIRADTVRELYDYNGWANERLFQSIEGLSQEQLHADLLNGIGSIHTTLVHIVSGAWIWRTRWQGGTPTEMLHAADFPTLPAIRVRWQEEDEQMKAFLAILQDSDLNRDIRYVSTAVPGRVFTLPLWKTMLHQINHQTQHRSEIAMRLTALSRSPGELGMSTYFNRALL